MSDTEPVKNWPRSQPPRVYLTEYAVFVLVPTGLTFLLSPGAYDSRARFALIVAGVLSLPTSFGLIAFHEGFEQARDEWRDFADLVRKSISAPAPTGFGWAMFRFVGGLALVIATPMLIWNEAAGWTTVGVAVLLTAVAVFVKVPDTVSRIVYIPMAVTLIVTALLVGFSGAVVADQWRVVVLTGISYVLAVAVFWVIDRMASPSNRDVPDLEGPEGGE